ncbi:uncharacterized protein LOC144903080 isoform X2 [Branchiostoma floridae x Branchiostoma belcheri]
MSNKARRMLVLLLIILKEAGLTAACSSRCSWTWTCVCNRMDLTSVPQDLPTDITGLYLERNTITTLNQSDFSRNQTCPQAAAQIESSDAARTIVGRDTRTDEEEYDDVLSPSQTSQPGSGQIQHLGSSNDGYEVPPPSVCPGEGPQSRKYVNSNMAAAAKNAAAGPQVTVYENDEESVDNQSQTAAAPGADSPHHYEPLRNPSSQQHTYTPLLPHGSQGN